MTSPPVAHVQCLNRGVAQVQHLQSGIVAHIHAVGGQIVVKDGGQIDQLGVVAHIQLRHAGLADVEVLQLGAVAQVQAVNDSGIDIEVLQIGIDTDIQPAQIRIDAAIQLLQIGEQLDTLQALDVPGVVKVGRLLLAVAVDLGDAGQLLIGEHAVLRAQKGLDIGSECGVGEILLVDGQTLLYAGALQRGGMAVAPEGSHIDAVVDTYAVSILHSTADRIGGGLPTNHEFEHLTIRKHQFHIPASKISLDERYIGPAQVQSGQLILLTL